MSDSDGKDLIGMECRRCGVRVWVSEYNDRLPEGWGWIVLDMDDGKPEDSHATCNVCIAAFIDGFFNGRAMLGDLGVKLVRARELVEELSWKLDQRARELAEAPKKTPQGGPGKEEV